MAKLGFTCSCCGERHDDLPLAFGAPAPAYWMPEHAEDPRSSLDSDLCVIECEHFFVRATIEIPIRDSAEVFSWGVWVSQSQESFERVVSRWESEGREHDESTFGWLSSVLPMYPETIGLATRLHQRPVGERPVVQLEPTDHPLAVEQREGITRDRVVELVELLLHPAGSAAPDGTAGS
ncbi:DUF2199 domain-containing protein [Actinokineospora enzanensis]|uniref:DUF2199 domain-containing protein n=1 Tax=Actinokineospora enzanensis TaxID=155975 RepID=UPI000374780D|nr:DUF2199 domain-containing protein [Actinokineospora enzanensis]